MNSEAAGESESGIVGRSWLLAIRKMTWTYPRISMGGYEGALRGVDPGKDSGMGNK